VKRIKKKKTIVHTEHSGSLKTFFLYAALVFIILLIAIGIRAYFIFKHNKFHGNYFSLIVAQNNQVKELVAYNPTDDTLSIAEIDGQNIPLDRTGRQLGFIADGHISLRDDQTVTEDVNKVLSYGVMHMHDIRTDLTIFDLIRLAIHTKNISPANITEKKITLPKDDHTIDTALSSLLTDSKLASENTSVQIVNASEVSGLGIRLERVLANLGANVVSVTTARDPQTKSQIQYYGEETYALQSIKSMLPFTVSKLTHEPIADIVITLGKDSAETNKF
jgi:hypothetical protein